jgi:ABC-2 type transport system ATP-binding protein
MIEVNYVSKHFGSIKALNDVSFRVEKGEIAGLLGRNGAGKTTMLRILSCFFPPSEGRIRVAEINPETNSLLVRKKIGYFLEKTPVYNEMRVIDFLEFVAGLKGILKQNRKKNIAEIVEVCGLGDVLNRITGNLSKGYRTRIGLAQALLGNPEVLLLDEPTVGLDPEQIIEIRDLIKRLAGSKTILLSTHILPEVSQLCSKIIILNSGEVVAAGNSQNLNTFLNKSNTSFSTIIESPNGQVVEILNATPGIVNVQLKKSVSKSASQFLIDVAENIDFPPILCAMAFQNHWILREIRPVQMNLEEIFVELIRKETLH